MRKYIIIALLILVVVSGYLWCAKKKQIELEQVNGIQSSLSDTASGGALLGKPHTIYVSGTQRSYILYVPSSYDPETPSPLIFAFHGGGSNASNMEKTTGFNALAETEGFIVTYPMGVSKSATGTPQGTWNGGSAGGGYAYEQNIDDIAFVKAMVKDISSAYSIDTNMIYATGISMGGMISYRIACELSDTFAAIAPVATSLVLSPGTCKPSRPVPVIHLHGTADKFIPYNGGNSSRSLPKVLAVGGPYISVNDSLAVFKEINNTDDEGDEVYNEGDTVCTLWGGRFGADVELCTIKDGGHNWPGSDTSYGPIVGLLLGKTSKDINATETIWDFFYDHPKED